MKAIAVVKRAGIDLVKGALASLAAFVGLVIGGMVTRLIGLTPTSLPAYTNMTILMPLMLISGITIAIVLGECFQRLTGASGRACFQSEFAITCCIIC